MIKVSMFFVTLQSQGFYEILRMHLITNLKNNYENQLILFAIRI